MDSGWFCSPVTEHMPGRCEAFRCTNTQKAWGLNSKPYCNSPCDPRRILYLSNLSTREKNSELAWPCLHKKSGLVESKKENRWKSGGGEMAK